MASIRVVLHGGVVPNAARTIPFLAQQCGVNATVSLVPDDGTYSVEMSADNAEAFKRAIAGFVHWQFDVSDPIQVT